jgi:serine acetyltransferase
VTLEELARRLDCSLEGNPAQGAIDITRAAALGEAGPGEITFLSNPRYASLVPATRASAIIADDSLTNAPCAVLRTKEVYLTFARAVGLLTPPSKPKPGVSSLASIDPTATIGPDASIGAFAVIGAGVRIGARSIVHPHVTIGSDSSIGEDCELHAQVSVRDRVEIGSRVLLQNGAVIGSDGYGFARRPDGSHEKIPQVGRVVIEDDVEVGANSTDRSARGRRDADWPWHEDRQSRPGRAWREDRPTRAAGRTGRHRRQHDARGRRDHGGPIRRHGPRPSGRRRDRQREVRRDEGRGRPAVRSPAFRPATSLNGGIVRPCPPVAGTASIARRPRSEAGGRSRRRSPRRQRTNRAEPSSTARAVSRFGYGRRAIIPVMLRRLCFRIAILLTSVVALTSATGPDTIVRPTKFDYTMTTLPNGLQVVFLEDHSTPIVHAALWYHVGSKDEKQGRTGFAICSST